MSSQLKLSLVVAGACLLVLAGALGLGALAETERRDRTAPSTGESRLVRADSHVLGERADRTGSKEVVFVEFLDFECEGCRAAYPAVEDLRERYAGEVTFVIRYFPLPGHVNAERAARAVEAAARQGRLEEMYRAMYETQEQWGEQRVPLDAVFRGLAEDLGLDLEQYDADYADPATAARVQKDVDDGTALGVSGTPTFFLDGERIQPRDAQDLTDAVDAALAAR